MLGKHDINFIEHGIAYFGENTPPEYCVWAAVRYTAPR